MNKLELRNIMVSQRQQLSVDESRRRSIAIAKRVQATVNWQNIQRIHVYRSNESWREVDTSWVEAYIYAMWPHIKVDTGDTVKTAPFPTNQYDLILVPMVAFDERLNRLGLGAGWYDRFLVLQPNAIVIGLAYELQRVSQLVSETHDQPMNLVVTEQRVYP